MTAPFAWTQSTPDDQAERLYTNAGTFMAAGKYSEALADLQRIVDNYSQSPWADKALLEIGNYYLTVENDANRALGYYKKIQDEYANSESAPAAYYWKASILERMSASRSGLEAAVADLIRMLNLYNNHEWEAGALYLLSRLGMRLGDYAQSLSYAQRLEFSYPNSPFTPKALLQSSKVAYFMGKPKVAATILGRLQTRYADSQESETAEHYLRVLRKFSDQEPRYALDRGFPGAVPKKYKNPYSVAVSDDGLVGVLDGNGAHFASQGDAPRVNITNPRDLVGLCLDVSGELRFVYEDRVAMLDNTPAFASLTVAGEALDRIQDAAVDGMGRLYVIDSDIKDVAVFDRNGAFIKRLSLNKPVTLACFENAVWAVGDDDSRIVRYDAAFNRIGVISSGLNAIRDLSFDHYGNLYVLYDKGDRVAIFDREQQLRATFNLKSGGFPLKEAQSIAVDKSGALYLVDRRGGSVYRFM